MRRPLSPAARFFFRRVFPLCFLAAGLIMLWFGGRGLWLARESAAWPTAEGVISHSTIEYHRGSKGGGTYHAAVRYDFIADDRRLSGSGVAFGDYGSSDRSHAQTIVDRYPVGARVKVYYRPADPLECVLEPGVAAQAFILPGVALVFLAAGAALAFFLLRAG